MIGTFLLLLATAASMELVTLTRLMRQFPALARTGGRAGALILRNGVSEWAKERAIRLTAMRLLGQSLRTAGRLALVALPLILLITLDAHYHFGVARIWRDWPTRLLLLAVTSAYAVVRRQQRHAQPAAEQAAGGERLLQRIALGGAWVPEITFDIERHLYGAAAAAIPGPAPVFVTGLARAGTTILMRALHDTGDFASLSYRDLPFPLAPNGWARVARRLKRDVALRERAHGDGIMHDLDSPEAIEEFFWRQHEGAHYRSYNGLSPVPPTPETVTAFAAYARLVLLRYERPRYLSKNNNNILRLPALVAAFPDAILLHPFRDPEQQAASLLRQHRSACALATEDPFRGRFMTWLGHHEFGADRRRFLLPDGPRIGDDPGGVDYWLKSWIAAYGFLLDAVPDVRRNQLFIDYDRLTRDGRGMAPVFRRRLGLSRLPDLGILRSPSRHQSRKPDARLLATAGQIHRALVARADDAVRSSRTVRAPQG